MNFDKFLSTVYIIFCITGRENRECYEENSRPCLQVFPDQENDKWSPSIQTSTGKLKISLRKTNSMGIVCIDAEICRIYAWLKISLVHLGVFLSSAQQTADKLIIETQDSIKHLREATPSDESEQSIQKSLISHAESLIRDSERAKQVSFESNIV